MKYLKEDFIYLIVLSIYLFFCFSLPYLGIEVKTINSEKIMITIDDGMTAREIAYMLQEKAVIKKPKLLLKNFVKMKFDRSIKSGQYKIVPGNEMFVAYQFKTLRPNSKFITIIPGSRFNEVSKLLGSGEQFYSSLSNIDNFPVQMRDILPHNPKDRIAFLLPNTYSVVDDANFVDKFVKMSSLLWYREIYKKIDLKYTPKQWLEFSTMASIVEKEAKREDEKALIAGVFYNRIKNKMKMQSCATVVYSWSEKDIIKKSLSYKDLEVISPYNTYINIGLPPGPIAVPSVSSWFGAIHPVNTDYLFFFARPDGSHEFSTNYNNHIMKQKQ
ncbi:MAG: endolytic transglycosylase MltG [Synergistaceae bacterium]